MIRACTFITAALLAVGAGFAHAGAKKQSAASVRVYGQGGIEGQDFAQKVPLLNSSRTVYMQTMPLISERDIVAYYPFPARDNSGTYACYFKLDNHGADLLSQHTMANRDTYLLAFFNGRHIADIYIDRGVSDGILYIPTGLRAGDLELLSMTFPEIGNEKAGTHKRPAPTPAPKPTPDKKASAAPAAAMPIPAPAMARQPDGSLAPAPVYGSAPAQQQPVYGSAPGAGGPLPPADPTAPTSRQ
jgi:hypothetical protein